MGATRYLPTSDVLSGVHAFVKPAGFRKLRSRFALALPSGSGLILSCEDSAASPDSLRKSYWTLSLCPHQWVELRALAYGHPVPAEPRLYDVLADAAAYFTPSWSAEHPDDRYPISYVPNDPADVAAFVGKLNGWFTDDALPRALTWLSDPRLLLRELQDRRPYRYPETQLRVEGHPALLAVLAAEVGDGREALKFYSQVSALASSHPYGGESRFEMFLEPLQAVLARYGVRIQR